MKYLYQLLILLLLSNTILKADLVDISENLELKYPLYYDKGIDEEFEYFGDGKIKFDRLDKSRLYASHIWTYSMVDSISGIFRSDEIDGTTLGISRLKQIANRFGNFTLEYDIYSSSGIKDYFVAFDSIQNIEEVESFSGERFLLFYYNNFPKITTSGYSYNDRSFRDIDIKIVVDESSIIVSDLGELNLEEIIVYDVNGRIYYRSQISTLVGNNMLIEKDKVPNGYLFITLKYSDGTYETQIINE